MTNSADSDQKPTDLDLYCLQRQGISRFSRTRVNTASIMGKEPLQYKQTAKVQASLCILAVSPEPMLFSYVSNRARAYYSQRTRSGLPKGQVCSQKIRLNFQRAFSSAHIITKTCLYKFWPPQTPLLQYTLKLEFYNGIHNFFYFAKNNRLGTR